MARPKPPRELSRSRHTIAIPLMTAVAAWGLPKKKPTLQLRDFSDTVAKALNDYVEKHSPGSLEEAANQIRAYPEPDADGDLKAAEASGPTQYRLAPKPKPPDKTSRTPGAGPRHRVSA